MAAMYVGVGVVVLGAIWGIADANPQRHIKGIQIKNKGGESLWMEISGEDSFLLPPGQLASIILQDTWSGTIIARAEECQFQKCNSPHTIAELKFGTPGNIDYYHVSIKDGFNKPMKIQPSGHHNFCKTSACTTDVNQQCPKTHQVKNEDDVVVACKPNPELFKKICPNAFVSEDGPVTNKISCRTSDSYIIFVG